MGATHEVRPGIDVLVLPAVRLQTHPFQNIPRLPVIQCTGGHTYYERFGGLLNVYTRLGYNTPELCTQATSRQRAILVRDELIKQLLDCFPNKIEVVRVNKRFRALLRYRRRAFDFSCDREIPSDQTRQSSVAVFRTCALMTGLAFGFLLGFTFALKKALQTIRSAILPSSGCGHRAFARFGGVGYWDKFDWPWALVDRALCVAAVRLRTVADSVRSGRVLWEAVAACPVREVRALMG